jgi:2-polyprenyl-3-methyl-5-hydroxy-6-metoxy-1,4-benzoquinol methylase
MPNQSPVEIQNSSNQYVDVVEVPECAVCGARGFQDFASGFDYELHTCANRWQFVRCLECAHVWLNPRPASSAISVIYPANYYAYNYDEQVHWIARRGKELLDSSKMSSILARLNRRPHSYLDIGCGNGRFLKLMQSHTHLPAKSLYGLDIDQTNILRLAASGYQVFCKRIEDLTEIPTGSIDLVTLFHVLEHVEDPTSVIRKVGCWLSPGGMVAVETPNIDSWDARLFRDCYWGGYHFPRHWHLFSPSTLTRVFKQCDLRPIGTFFQTGHTFWAYSCHHWLGDCRRPLARLARRFDPFKTLLPVILFTGFDKLRASCGCRTSSMLMLARKQADPVNG